VRLFISRGLGALYGVLLVLGLASWVSEAHGLSPLSSDHYRNQAVPRSLIFHAAADVAWLRLQVYDLSGALVFDSGLRKGPTIQWNLETQKGRPAANGVYLYVITAQGRNGRLMTSRVRLISVIR